MEAMTLGFFALMLLLCSAGCLHYKRPAFGLFCNVMTIVLTYLTGCSWKAMLIESGKDTALLGFHRYPAAPIFLTLLLISTFVFAIMNIVGLIKQNKA